METSFILPNIEKLGFEYKVGPHSTDEDILKTEARLNVRFPEQLRVLYRTINGLVVLENDLTVYSLDELQVAGNYIPFAKFDNRHEIGFAYMKENAAGQWDIVNISSGFVVTLTVASFWSNKIFAWLKSQRALWDVEIYS